MKGSRERISEQREQQVQRHKTAIRRVHLRSETGNKAGAKSAKEKEV